MKVIGRIVAFVALAVMAVAPLANAVDCSNYDTCGACAQACEDDCKAKGFSAPVFRCDGGETIS